MLFIKNLIRRFLQSIILDAILHPKIFLHVLPGGKMPVRKSGEAIGYDAFARAIVCAHEMDPVDSRLRKTLFNFASMPLDPEVVSHVVRTDRDGKTILGYAIHPGESVLIGIGFATAMPFPLFYWVAPRSGLASKYKITVGNAPGTVDPDYRGEAGVIVYNRGETDFIISQDMRIVQTAFQWAVIPEVTEVARHDDLPPTMRGAGGFGSTGLYG